MAFSSVESISHEDFVTILARLDILLSNLPAQLPAVDGPSSRYGTFLSFGLDADILEKTGDEVATLGEQLEHIFGWKTRTSGDGIIPILERGNAIRALHPLFTEYYKKYPDNNVLKKWVIDVTAGAEKAESPYVSVHNTTVHYTNLGEIDPNLRFQNSN